MRPIVRERILKKCKYKCVNCGAKEDLQVDHIVPLSRGGEHSEFNFQILCKTCNLKKHNSIDVDKYFKGFNGGVLMRRDFPLQAFNAVEMWTILKHQFKKYEALEPFENNVSK